MSAPGSLLDRLGAWLPALASHLWVSTIFLAGALLVLLAVGRRVPAGARFALALAGIAKFALPAALVTAAARGFGPRLAAPLPELPRQLVDGPLSLPAPSSAGPPAWMGAVVALWLAVALLLAARQSLARRRLVALVVRTARPPLRREAEALGRARRQLGVRRSVDLVRSPLPEAPAVVRVVRPLVVLPEGECDQLSDEELEALLLHEVAHVARRDNLWARLEALVGALFWFHPLLWVARAITRTERERACDERVADAAGEQTYLAALRKFCHAAIAPRLPGVSCMATAKLEGRIEHVMGYAARRNRQVSGGTVAAIAVASLAVFTVLSGLAGGRAAAEEPSGAGPYAVRATATRSGDDVTLRAEISENATGNVVSAPAVRFRADQEATVSSASDELQVRLRVTPDAEGRLDLLVEVDRAGERVQTTELVILPDGTGAGAVEPRYSGDPINMSLKDADLRDVLGTFGRITGMEVEIDEGVQGLVTVEWVNVPWDRALHELLAEHGLRYHAKEGVLRVSRQ